jgi:hypothetical protein
MNEKDAPSMSNQQPIRQIFVLSMAAILLLSGCGPAVTVLVQSWLTVARVQTSGQPEPVEGTRPGVTPSPEAATITEPGIQRGEAVPLCPEIARPALFLFLPDDEYALFDPARGESCPLPFVDALPGMAVMVQQEFFVASRTTGPEGAATVIQRYSADGTVEVLPYTLVDTQAGTTLVAFTISADARWIAWSVLGPAGGSDLPSTSLFIANLATGEVVGGVAPEVGEAPLALAPIRFSDDGSVLYYALHPYGLGGIWSSYVARYTNLYALSTAGTATPELLFDCANFALLLCLGDFFVVDHTVTGLAYVDAKAKAVIIENGEGTVLNTLQSEAGYIGYPTWGPGGEFVYYTAELAEDVTVSPLPARGFLQRVTPPIAPPKTLVGDARLLLPIDFLNETQLVVGWAGENDTRGLALVGVDGSVQVLDVPAGAALLHGSAVSTLLGASSGMVSLP